MNKGSKKPPLLLVDDSPDDHALFRAVLAKAGVENPLVSVGNAEQAIAWLRRACPAGGASRGDKPLAIFLDLHMPGPGGLDVLRWIRRRKAFLKSRVIMLTSSQQPADLQRAAALGADGYLLKHPRPETIAAILRDAAASRARASPPADTGRGPVQDDFGRVPRRNIPAVE